MSKAILSSYNIISALGFSTAENFLALYNSISGLSPVITSWENVEPVTAALINNRALESETEKNIGDCSNLLRFEQLSIVSILKAVENQQINLSDKRVLFILSTTKGNIDLLDSRKNSQPVSNKLYLWQTAQNISGYFKNPNVPVVVSNACISGLSALVTAKRWLATGIYDSVVVTGTDLISKFTVSGFQSLKALSPTNCRPFDAERCGLNLGEGAATIILSSGHEKDCSGKVTLEAGAISNDANHISGPSRTGEGLVLAIKKALENCDIPDIGFINAHGTATLFNDEMEAVAINRCGLANVPVNSLKGYIGHTMGASGLIETILSAESLIHNTILGTAGFSRSGVSVPMNIVTGETASFKKECLKTASGFGGCNAAIRLRLNT